MNARRLGPVALSALLTLGACSSGPGTDPPTRSSPAAATTSPASSAPASAHDAAYSLHLSTGAETPLSSTSTADFGSGAPFDEGRYYAASPDGSRIYWESLDNVSVEASIDVSQGSRVDPQGPIDYYAGGWSPDGTKFVYQRRDSRGDAVGNLYVEDRATGHATRITDLAQKTRSGWWYLAPTFSCDSRNVVFQFPQLTPAGERFALWSVPVTGGEPTLLFRNAAQATTCSKNTFAFVRPVGDGFVGPRLVLVSPHGVRTLVTASGGVFEPKLSPDGKQIAYSDDGSIRVVDAATGTSSEVATGRMAAWLDNDTLIVAPDS